MVDMARGLAAVVDTTHGGPEKPTITNKDLWDQFKIDIRGKEVQSAETYSHSWVANQFGHVCLGILLATSLGIVFGTVAGSVLTALGVSGWEWKEYRRAVKRATGSFPVDRPLLRDNAVVAAAYMLIGVALVLTHRFFVATAGELLRVPNLVWGALCFLGLAIVAVRLALRWLRQKIVWQKAGLPYLFRLSETRPTMSCQNVEEVQKLIETAPPPARHPCQIVIGGPIGSGRTEFAAAIGTEFAFRQAASVRYLSFATLLEFVARSRNSPDFFNDIGPVNISYWPWSKAQVVIIDDIGPLLTSQGAVYEHQVDWFRRTLGEELSRASAVLARCHTVWVIGDLRGAGQIASGTKELDSFGEVIRQFCGGLGQGHPRVLVAQLAGEPESESVPQRQQRSKTPRIAEMHYLS